MPDQEFIFERRGSIAVATINRPQQLGALNYDTQQAILEACRETEADDSIKALVFASVGRGFSAGADLTGGPRRSPEDPVPQTEKLDELGWVGRQAITVAEVTKPTIAAVNGVAVGAGMSLALACDMRVGSMDARFKTVFLERSLSPDAGMTYFLPRIVGYSRAMELVLSSRDIRAEEAYEMGLLNRLVREGDLLEATLAFAEEVSWGAPLAMRAAKRVMQRNMDRPLREAILQERLGLIYSRLAPNDMRESRDAFVEKRKPKFTGT